MVVLGGWVEVDAAVVCSGFKGRTQWLGGILVRGILVVRVFWGAGI